MRHRPGSFAFVADVALRTINASALVQFVIGLVNNIWNQLVVKNGTTGSPFSTFVE